MVYIAMRMFFAPRQSRTSSSLNKRDVQSRSNAAVTALADHVVVRIVEDFRELRQFFFGVLGELFGHAPKLTQLARDVLHDVVRHLVVGEQVKPCHSRSPFQVARQRSVHGLPENLGCVLVLHLPGRCPGASAGEARVVVIHPILPLVPRHGDLAAVHDNYVVAAIVIGEKYRLVPALKHVGDHLGRLEGVLPPSVVQEPAACERCPLLHPFKVG